MEEVREEEIKLRFLMSGSNDALPSSYFKLRSYLNIHSSNLANLHDLKLPKCFTKSNLTCRQCFLPWSYDTCSIKLLPVKKRKKSSKKKKVDCKKQRPQFKIPRNHLILRCTVCNSQTHFYLTKVTETREVVVQNKNVLEKRKKKKKKDKKCGLGKYLETSAKKCESSKSSTNKTKSSTLKPTKAATPTASSNRNLQKINSQEKNSHLVSPAKNIPQSIRIKKLNSNPTKLQSKLPKKNNKNLQKLRKIIQEHKEPVKKTLKDFLTLI